MPLKDLTRRAEYKKAYRKRPGVAELDRERFRNWRKINPRKDQKNRQDYRIKVKLEVLSHYGPEGHFRCGWPDCLVNDPDILTLDHINNDGGTRRAQGEPSGYNLYNHLRLTGYPSGYQTLCMNHNLKKEILHRRESVERHA